METARTPKNGAHRLPAILRPHMVSIVRRGLINGGREPAACSRANLRPGPRSLLDRNAVEVVDPDAPDVAVVVLGSDVSNPMRSPPLDELAAQAHPRHLVDLPSEEDAGVETPPPHDALHPLTDHNYRLTVKVEADDEVIGPSVFRTAVPIRRNLDDEDEEVDVEIEDDVEAAMSVMFGESPERPARTSDAAIKHEPLSSPEASPALSETGSRASAPSRGDGTRPGWRNCPICDVAVMGVMGYRDHMLARHMRPQPYRCLACWKTFSLAKDLIRHTNNNCAVVMYKCQRCDRVWSSDVHHAACEACAAAAAAGSVGPEEDKDSVYECAACARTFPLLRHLMAHVKTHPDVAKPFKCHTCGLCFNASVRLMIHVRAHTLSPSKKSLASSRPRAPAPSPAAKRARNGAAGKAGAGAGGGGGATPRAPRPALAYPNPALAYANPAFILKMEPPEPHSDDEFADQAGPFNDDDYHDDFKDAMGLDDVDDDDDAENWDEFDEDDDGSENQEAMLDEAMSVASPPGPASWKRFKCKLCPRTFRFSHQVGVHMRTHTRERPYSCRLCDATFRQSNHLKRHLYHNHGLAGPAAAQAFRSMIALKKRRLQRERFRALTAFFAKQGGFKGFGSSVEEAAEVNLLLDRGFDKDLSGHQNRAARKTPDDHFLTKPWIKLGHSARPNGVNGPAAPAAAAPASPPAPSPTSAPAHAANGRPVPPENGMPS